MGEGFASLSVLVHKTIPNPYEHGRSRYHGLDSTRNLTAEPGEIYIDEPGEIYIDVMVNWTQ